RPLAGLRHAALLEELRLVEGGVVRIGVDPTEFQRVQPTRLQRQLLVCRRSQDERLPARRVRVALELDRRLARPATSGHRGDDGQRRERSRSPSHRRSIVRNTQESERVSSEPGDAPRRSRDQSRRAVPNLHGSKGEDNMWYGVGFGVGILYLVLLFTLGL